MLIKLVPFLKKSVAEYSRKVQVNKLIKGVNKVLYKTKNNRGINSYEIIRV